MVAFLFLEQHILFANGCPFPARQGSLAIACEGPHRAASMWVKDRHQAVGRNLLFVYKFVFAVVCYRCRLLVMRNWVV